MDPTDPRIDPSLVRSGSRAVVVAEKQEEYLDLPSVKTVLGQTITRWALTEDERRRIAEGEDIYITILGFGAINPLMPTVGVVDWKPCWVCRSNEGEEHIPPCPFAKIPTS